MLPLSANEALPDRPPGEMEEAIGRPAHPDGADRALLRPKLFAQRARSSMRGRRAIGGAKGPLELRPHGELWQER
jgi:hypothetical protein